VLVHEAWALPDKLKVLAMNEQQRCVQEFHERFLSDVRATPGLVDDHKLLMRSRLIVEEAGELVAAAAARDLVGMADALVDLLYVAYGTAVVLGLDLEPLFAEVHRSNMTKHAPDERGGKVVKGPTFSAPQLRGLLKQQGWVETAARS
jgi:predicted HAD superfamily Cof-like phosphohydrolase